MINYYQILHLNDFAEIDEVKQSFKLLTWHFKTGDKENNESFYSNAQKQIDQAYRILSSSKSKIQYDQSLKDYLDNSKKEKEALNNKIESLKSSNRNLENKLNNKSVQISQLESDNRIYIEKNKSLAKKLKKLKKEIEKDPKTRKVIYYILGLLFIAIISTLFFIFFMSPDSTKVKPNSTPHINVVDSNKIKIKSIQKEYEYINNYTFSDSEIVDSIISTYQIQRRYTSDSILSLIRVINKFDSLKLISEFTFNPELCFYFQRISINDSLIKEQRLYFYNADLLKIDSTFYSDITNDSLLNYIDSIYQRTIKSSNLLVNKDYELFLSEQ